MANNDHFRRTLKNLKCNITGYLEFPDHHSYSDSDIEDILAAAQKSRSECLVTTEKDYVRIAHKIPWSADLYVVGIEIEFDADTKRFNGFIKDRLNEIMEKI